MRVGIPLIQSELSGRSDWIAGFYYVRTCLNALAMLPADEVPQTIVFMPDTLEEPLIFPEYADQATWLTEVRIPGDVIRVNNTELQQQYIERYPCDLVFPLIAGIPLASFSSPAIGWIPDFQHKHYPQFFSDEDIRFKELFNNFLVGYCEKIVCTSQAVWDDLNTFYPYLQEKGVVLRPSAILPQQYLENDPGPVLARLGITQKYAYLPNQFWIHKNHKTVFEAWKHLKLQGADYPLICTGQSHDYRFPGYYQELEAYLDENGLRDNIRLLGFLGREEQIQLYRGASVVLQPSLFEGWSASVEEAKSLGKPLIISGIPIHREKCGMDTLYFDKDNAKDLANILLQVWDTLPEGHSSTVEVKALAEAQRRAEEFGRNLVRVFEETAKTNRAAPHGHEKRLLLPLITELTRLLDVSEADRAARLDQIHELTRLLQESEADRAARLEVIRSQERILNRLPVRLLRRLKII